MILLGLKCSPVRLYRMIQGRVNILVEYLIMNLNQKRDGNQEIICDIFRKFFFTFFADLLSKVDRRTGKYIE